MRESGENPVLHTSNGREMESARYQRQATSDGGRRWAMAVTNGNKIGAMTMTKGGLKA
jgi:hypothetical protein